ncbi:hypothetical protein [Staphylococcus epidermidis]|nr:hypothetical protein [Staphylococcus epidermidis]
MLDWFGKEVVDGGVMNRGVSEGESGSGSRGGGRCRHGVKGENG